MLDDTIVAPATPFGTGGIAVIRLSGARALEIAKTCIQKDASNQRLAPRYATLVVLTNSLGDTIDDAIATFFKAPDSYTGEDVVELSCHGSSAVVSDIVDSCCFHGARPAEPGEFTRRAFLNGKIDLVQAEAVAGLIHTNTSQGASLNYKMLQGALSENLNSIKLKLINLLSRLEFELDISEAEAQPGLPQFLSAQIASIIKELTGLLSTYQQGKLLTSGASVVIAGPPNVGKSTLLNALSNSNRAITSPKSGTTRDSVDITLIMDGVPIRLVDTAGLRSPIDSIEREGIRRTQEQIKLADLIISMNEPGINSDDHFSDNGIPEIRLINKSDLIKELDSVRQKHPDHLFISAKYGAGLDKLKTEIRESLHLSPALSSNVCLTSSRQRDAIQSAHDFLSAGRNLLKNEYVALELLAIEIRSSLEAIDLLLGKTTTDDILDNIFSQFCVGK